MRLTTTPRISATVSTSVDGDTRRLCSRLHDEKDNPPHLQRNLSFVQAYVIQALYDQGITTTRDSVTTALLYIAQGNEPDGPMRTAILGAIR